MTQPLETTPRRRARAPWLAALVAALFCALPSAQADGPAAKPVAQQQASAGSGVVNLNSANEAELTRLPGIGPAKARAILDLRSRMKRFNRVEDIMRVKGIGRKTFRKLRPMLTLSGGTTLTAATTPKQAKKKR